VCWRRRRRDLVRGASSWDGRFYRVEFNDITGGAADLLPPTLYPDRLEVVCANRLAERLYGASFELR